VVILHYKCKTRNGDSSVLVMTDYRLDNHQKVEQSNYRPGHVLRVQEVAAPIFQDNRHMKVMSALRTGPSTPQEIPRYSFLLEAESTPGPQCDRKDFVHAKFQ